MFRTKRSFLSPAPLHLTVGSEDHWDEVAAEFRAHLLTFKDVEVPTALDVTLPSKVCPTLMLPWSDAMMGSSAACQAYASERFVATHGARAAEWDVVWDDAGFGQPRLACAVPKRLLDALNTTALDCGVGLRSVRPRMVAAMRAAIPEVRQGIATIVESDFLTICVLERRRVVTTHGMPWRRDGLSTVAGAVARFFLRHPYLKADQRIAVIDVGASLSATGLGAGIGQNLELVRLHAN